MLVPYGDNRRYDLALDRDGKLIRIQVKNGRLRNGKIIYNTSSRYTHRGRSERGYEGEADYFAIYCPDTDKCYFVRVEDAARGSACLRIATPRNGQKIGVRMADDHVFIPV